MASLRYQDSSLNIWEMTTYKKSLRSGCIDRPRSSQGYEATMLQCCNTIKTTRSQGYKATRSHKYCRVTGALLVGGSMPGLSNGALPAVGTHTTTQSVSRIAMLPIIHDRPGGVSCIVTNFQTSPTLLFRSIALQLALYMCLPCSLAVIETLKDALPLSFASPAEKSATLVQASIDLHQHETGMTSSARSYDVYHIKG